MRLENWIRGAFENSSTTLRGKTTFVCQIELLLLMICKGAQELLALAAGAYTGFRGIKHVVVFLLSTGYHPLTG